MNFLLIAFITSILSGYSIVYNSNAEEEMGKMAAMEVAQAIQQATGEDLPVVADTIAPKRHRIVIENVPVGDLAPFGYEVFHKKGDLMIRGGSCWAISGASAELKEKLEEGSTLRKLKFSGSVYGQPLFAQREGKANLRIMDCNIWQYDHKTPPKAWTEMGLSPCNNVRSVNFAAIAKAYLPDVFCMQEYSKAMDKHLRPLLGESGLELTFGRDSSWSFTPIFYNPKTVEMIDCGCFQHEPEAFNNASTKSVNYFVGKLRSNGGRFIVVNTHLWWKNETIEAGSDKARVAQTERILQFIDELTAAYPDATVTFMGDMNCTIESEAMQKVLAHGLRPVWDAARIYGDKSISHHYCKEDGFGRHGWGKTIDLAFVGNGNVVESFRRITAYFTLHTTDHYPNYIDFNIPIGIKPGMRAVDYSSLTLTGKMMPTTNPMHRVDTAYYKGFSYGEKNQLISSAGMAIAFKTNARNIGVLPTFGYIHNGTSTPPIATKGFDLYIRQDGEWVYAYSTAANIHHENEYLSIIEGMDGQEKECLLYLPMYSELRSLKLLVNEDAYISAIENPFTSRIVVHGSSFTQGIGVSRSGMLYTSQLSRHLGREFINLGCSGNAKMQESFLNVLCDVEADAFIFDVFSNPGYKAIEKLLFPFIERMKAAHPGVPLIFQQTIWREGRRFVLAKEEREQAKVDTAERLMEEACRKYSDVYFVRPDATDHLYHETCTDGTHPDNYGYSLWAQSIEGQISEILSSYGL